MLKLYKLSQITIRVSTYVMDIHTIYKRILFKYFFIFTHTCISVEYFFSTYQRPYLKVFYRQYVHMKMLLLIL